LRAIRTTRATSVTAGKTTLVRVLTTLLVPDAGRARVAGYDVVADSASLRSVIGLAGQYAAVDELLTGRENLELVGLWYHLEKPEYRRRAQEVLERFSLTDAGDKLVKGYSGGMRPLFPPFPRMSDIRYREAPRLTRPYGVEGAGRRRRRGRGIRRPQRRWFLVRANPSKDGTAALGQGERLYSAAMDRLAMPGTTAEERKAAKAGTVAERRAYVAARREAARERDADRYRLAVELAQRTQIEIPAAEGFVVVPPGVVESAGAVVAATNAVIDSIGHEQLTAGKGKKAGSIAMGFLPPEQRELGSPYLRFALSAEVVGPIAAYFGIVPVLLEMDAPGIPSTVEIRRAARSSGTWIRRTRRR
jgi:ABC transporter